jgi:hypothetical protein
MRLTCRARGVTRVEVIVVAALAALLLTLLAPAPKLNRAFSERLTCLSNMQYLGLASHAYAAEFDELIVPIHEYMVRNTAGVPHLGRWSWLTVNAFAWGGATASQEFYVEGGAPGAVIGQRSLRMYGATTRPLTRYLHPDLYENWQEGTYVTEVKGFRCPSDIGYPDDNRVDDAPQANAGRSCYDTLGNSYRVYLGGSYQSSGGADYTGALSSGAWGQRLSDLTNTDELVLAADPLFLVMPGFGQYSRTAPIGWHGATMSDNVLYVDGSARLTAAVPLTPAPLDPNVPTSWVPLRGPGYRFDVYPNPGARIWGDWSGMAGWGWPFAGYIDNLNVPL